MRYDRAILICTILVAVIYLWATTNIPTLEIGDPLGPKAFPRLLGIALLIAAGMFGLELWKNRRKMEAPADRVFDPSAGATSAIFDKHVMLVLAAVTVWTGIYYAIFNPLGFVVATSIYLLPMMAYFNRGKWIMNILSAVGFSLLIYYLFVKLDVNLPQGILPF